MRKFCFLSGKGDDCHTLTICIHFTGEQLRREMIRIRIRYLKGSLFANGECVVSCINNGSCTGVTGELITGTKYSFIFYRVGYAIALQMNDPSHIPKDRIISIIRIEPAPNMSYSQNTGSHDQQNNGNHDQIGNLFFLHNAYPPGVNSCF